MSELRWEGFKDFRIFFLRLSKKVPETGAAFYYLAGGVL